MKEHPEHRKLVYRARRHDGQETTREEVIPQKRNLFRKNGLPRHPERSIYYDPVMNPFGVAPPGMPYMERGQHTVLLWMSNRNGFIGPLPALRPDEIESDDENGVCVSYISSLEA